VKVQRGESRFIGTIVEERERRDKWEIRECQIVEISTKIKIGN